MKFINEIIIVKFRNEFFSHHVIIAGRSPSQHNGQGKGGNDDASGQEEAELLQRGRG